MGKFKSGAVIGPPPFQMMRRVLLAVLVLLLIGLLKTPLPVLAHANLDKAEPAPDSIQQKAPTRVTIWFTEPIESGFSEIQVLNELGEIVDNGDSQVEAADPTALSVSLKPLSDGTYTVAWKNLSSVDGHRVFGSYVFGVGDVVIGETINQNPVEQPLLQAPSEPFWRWLILLGLMTIIGGLAFRLLVIGPALQMNDPAIPALDSRLTGRISRLIWLAAALFFIGSLAHLFLQTSLVHEVTFLGAIGRPALNLLSKTGWGSLWLWRMGLFLLLVVGLRRSAAAGMPPRHPISALTLLVGLSLALTISLTSHAAATEGIRTSAVISDYLHLLAASFWVGGLFHFALGMPLVLKTLAGETRRRFLAAVVPAFSTVASLSVGTLIITGLYSAYAQVTILPALQTPYGTTLLVKLLLMVPLLALGALNLLWIGRRLKTEDGAAAALRRSVTGEALISLFILGVVALLITLEPARQVASREGIGLPNALTFEDMVEGTQIQLAVEPGRVGQNRFVIELADRRGSPIVDASDILLQLVFLDADLSPLVTRVMNAGEGRYISDEVLLSIAGRWQAEINVIRPDAFDARTAFRFEAKTAGAQSSAAIAPDQKTGGLLWGGALLLLGLLFLGVSTPLGSWRKPGGRAVLMPGMASLAAGLILIGVGQFGPEPAKAEGNPFPPIQASIEVGEGIFVENCQTCHGPEGLGDGPAAASLTPPPANLAEHVPLHSDGELFNVVSVGVPETAMPPFGHLLNEEDRWHLINYLRVLTAKE